MIEEFALCHRAGRKLLNPETGARDSRLQIPHSSGTITVAPLTPIWSQ